jgi:hypothetical protein
MSLTVSFIGEAESRSAMQALTGAHGSSGSQENTHFGVKNVGELCGHDDEEGDNGDHEKDHHDEDEEEDD